MLTILLILAQLAQQPTRLCLPKADMAREIERAFGEHPTNGGEAQGNAYQLFVNEETRTWTLVVVTARGVACIVASGEGWEDQLGGRKYGPRA